MATFTTIIGDSFPVSATLMGQDLTGWKFACTVKKNKDQADASAVLTVGPRDVTAGEITASKFTHVFTAAQTKVVPAGEYYIDMQFTIPASSVDALPAGGMLSTPADTVEFSKDVTIRETA